MLKEVANYISEQHQEQVARDAAQVNIEKATADAAHSWVNYKKEGALTNAQLTALREASQALGRPLTDEQRKNVLALCPEKNSPPSNEKVSLKI